MLELDWLSNRKFKASYNIVDATDFRLITENLKYGSKHIRKKSHILKQCIFLTLFTKPCNNDLTQLFSYREPSDF